MAFSILEQLESSAGLLDVKRVGEIFGVKPRKIYQMIGHPAPIGWPCIRMGTQVKFDPSALAYWVRKQSPTFAAARKDALKEMA